MTWNRQDLEKGIEPDSCFYLQNAARFQGLNPEIPEDLPPDLVIEADIASGSDQKLPIYQVLGVPELWVYRQNRMQILDLRGPQIQSLDYSLAFSAVSVVKNYANTNFVISGGAGLVPGPFGLLAVVPEIALVIRNQLFSEAGRRIPYR